MDFNKEKGYISILKGTPLEEIAEKLDFNKISLKNNETLIISYPADKDGRSIFTYAQLQGIHEVFDQCFPNNYVILTPEQLHFSKADSKYKANFDNLT